VILKFHSEQHEDEDYQTETEPHHIHPPEEGKLSNRARFPNYHHQDLSSVLELIQFHILATQVQ
jgi:hypothetical protein